jgi:superfamily II DNA or RNA helicase
MLRDLNLHAVYDTSDSDIVQDLLVPLLSKSILYQRGVGYFTSGWLQLNMEGILQLILNRGRAEIITSPNLSREDSLAIEYGEQAKIDKILYENLKQEINLFESNLRYETLSLLAWLVADQLLDFKIAIPKNKRGDYHDKYAIFTDENSNVVVIHGSLNDSVQGTTYNGEGLSVFRSWEVGQLDYVRYHIQKFNHLNNNKNSFYDLYNIPTLIKEKLIKYKEFSERPYELEKTAVFLYRKDGIYLPKNINLYPYQKKAIEEWFSNDRKGLFAMATGTGKTFTSLSAAAEVFNSDEQLVLIISVPFTHLVEQWNKDAKEFGFNPLMCMGNSKSWIFQMKSLIDDYNHRTLNHLTFIVTHSSNSDEEKFLRQISRIKNKKNILFVGDEAHYLGSQSLRKALLPEIPMRIGLSATPERWRDEEGTQIIESYFDKEVISFPIEKAIEEGFLTSYDFHPHIVTLTEGEFENYNKLTQKIANAIASDEDTSRIETLLFQRNNIIHRSENKRIAFLELLQKDIEEIGLKHYGHTIVYCPEGEHRSILADVASLGLRVQEFVADTPTSKRNEILSAFAEKQIQVLVAMKCLDEGVNVPATRKAYFLASTSNPRQFVQRRGRVLRKSLGKEKAIIHDFFVFPPYSRGAESEKKMIKKEMARFMEFQFCCLNKDIVVEKIRPRLQAFDLAHLIYLSRDEIYETLKGDLIDE